MTGIVYKASAEQINPRVIELQQALNQLGYNAGSEDGVIGPATQKAIKAFQKDYDWKVDGQYSGLLLLGVQNEVSLARERVTPEGQARELEKKRLLSLSYEELIKEIRASEKKDAEQKLTLIGERARDLPARLFYEIIGLGKSGDLISQFVLRGLYYPESEEGIKQFQMDINAEPTGELTFGQVEELERRSIRIEDTKVYTTGGFGDELVISNVQGYLQVKGTWILEGEDIAYPINESKISCDRSRGECEVIQAEVIVPTIDSSDENYTLSVDSTTYSIVSWNESEVIARYSVSCRISMLTINFNSKEVFEVTRNNETKECREGYLKLPSLDKPRIARLVPGWNRTYKWWKDRQKKTTEYINPRFREKMKEAIKQ